MLHYFLGTDSFVEEYMYFIVKNEESKILLLMQHRRHFTTKIQSYKCKSLRCCKKIFK